MSDFNSKVADVLSEAAIYAADNAPDRLLAECESPIERLFLLALWANGAWTGKLDFTPPRVSLREITHVATASGRIQACPQVQIGKHRVDFLLAAARSNNEPCAVVAVECDGHEFHEKTKEQAARDKSRDREIMSRGVFVFRFTGREIWADAGKCAREVIEFLDAEWLDSTNRHTARVIEEFGSVEAYREAFKRRLMGDGGAA